MQGMVHENLAATSSVPEANIESRDVNGDKRIPSDGGVSSRDDIVHRERGPGKRQRLMDEHAAAFQ